MVAYVVSHIYSVSFKIILPPLLVSGVLTVFTMRLLSILCVFVAIEI